MQLSLGFKTLIFILFVNIGTVVQSMEIINVIPSLFSSCLSSLSSKQKPKKCRTHRLETNKQDFERIIDSLKDDNLPKTDTAFDKTKKNMHLNIASLLLWQEYDRSFFCHYVSPLLLNVDINSTNFLLFCYYQKYHDAHDRRDMSSYLFSSDKLKDLFNTCKEIRIDGYSALGAAIAAKDVSIENKRNFIQELMDHGFELTEKDRMLAAAEFHDAIPNDQKTNSRYLLHNSDQGNLSVLPHDVRKHIVHCMIDICKPIAWLLPKFQ